jgi:soluble cytochrome b562
MTKMTPREALYFICLELGPTAITNRDDNITHREAKLRDAIRTLQNFIDYRAPGDSMEELELEDFHHGSIAYQLKMELEDV